MAVWDIFNCKRTLLEGHKFHVWCTAISFDGKIVISGSADDTIRIWHIEEPFKNFVLVYKTANLPCIALTSDSETAVFGLADGQVKMCYIKAKNLILNLGKHEDNVQCVTVSNNYIVSSSFKNVILWSLVDRVQLHSFTLTHVAYMISIQISKDEKLILFNEAASNIILWNVERRLKRQTKRCRRIL